MNDVTHRLSTGTSRIWSRGYVTLVFPSLHHGLVNVDKVVNLEITIPESHNRIKQTFQFREYTDGPSKVSGGQQKYMGNRNENYTALYVQISSLDYNVIAANRVLYVSRVRHLFNT